MVTCSQCGAEYVRKPSKCGCGHRFSAADDVAMKPALDTQCRFTIGQDRCPAHNGGDGYCDWHTGGYKPTAASVVNYLRANGVPRSPPEWREVFVLACYAGMGISEIRAFDERLRRVYLSLPHALPNMREAYEQQLSRIAVWRRAMNSGQKAEAA